MERYTVSLEDELAEEFEQFIQQRGYKNRSEAIRDLIRDKLKQERLEAEPDSQCVGCLSYVYNHHERDLSRRLTERHHGHHDISLSTLHVHLDHDNCLEAVILKGKTPEVQAFADGVISQPGVRHGRLFILPMEET
ncbi:MAG: Nickel responsive regulator NikR [uncultured Thiotrichaceae bacterium]|uniref:Putative nickel-responsive regulator n=1 Tax=uncultured Thiotrichaceae bacterium TaxID=298394 RepID=A0A6S6TBT4_9GAMM|nr:MAG: Nickel responsive regulator NikR [uncultured Thiotrichaceae bacterium]